jgi:hypothetical protein
VVVDDPKATIFQDNLGGVCARLGSALAKQGRIPDAIAAFEQSRATYQKLLNSNPNDVGYKEGLLKAERDLAMLTQEDEL